MNIAKWNWKKLIRDWKTRILCGAFFIFFATFSFLFRQQNLSLPLDEMRNRYEVTQRTFDIIPEEDFQSEIGQEVYDLLAKQQRLYGMQRFILSEREGNTVENLEKVVSNYVDNGLQISENQLRLWELSEFPSYQVVTNTLPERKDIEEELSFLSYLQEHDLNIEWNPFSASHILQQELELMAGVLLFIFVALLGADRFTQDQTRNWSVTQGFPIPWKKQWHQRAIHLWALMWGVILSGTALSYISSLFRETPGSLSYPVSVYANGTFTQMATWQYGLLLIGCAMALSLLLMLLTTGLSWMNRNIYLTLGCVIAVYYLPSIWSVVPPFSSFQPSLYLHIPEVIKGISSDQFGLNGITFWKFPAMFLLLWGTLEVSFGAIFNLIPTQTIGLKRREAA